MADVQFADILFIFLVCVLIGAILALVNRTPKKTLAKASDDTPEKNAEIPPEPREDD